MKKYLVLLTTLFTVILSSCTNEDVLIRKTTIIRVNPSSVMSNFTYQLNSGDLDGVDSEDEIRIRLFIYDDKGSLVSESNQKVRNYLTTATFEIDLPQNESYTAIATTDVITSKSGAVPQYWEIVEAAELSTLRINYLGNERNYGDQEILGVKSETIYGGEKTTIDVEAAGALVCTSFENVHAYSDIQYIYVWGNRGNGFYDFSTQSELISNPNLEVKPDFKFMDVDDNHSGYGYSYKFIMPQVNYIFTLAFYDSDGKLITGNEEEGVTLKQGCEYSYHVILDPKYPKGYSTSFKDVTGKKYPDNSRSSRAIIQTSYEKTISTSTFKEPQKSWRIKDLIK